MTAIKNDNPGLACDKTLPDLILSVGGNFGHFFDYIWLLLWENNFLKLLTEEMPRLEFCVVPHVTLYRHQIYEKGISKKNLFLLPLICPFQTAKRDPFNCG